MMAYFSNGTEGSNYEGAVCTRCAHYGGCRVWMAHLFHNDSQIKDGEIIADHPLQIIIPNFNHKISLCRMFYSDDPEAMKHAKDQWKTFDAAMLAARKDKAS